jgi:RNA polymerase sigma factor (sigma-70 family)
MRQVCDERALWIARHVLPHEAALRSWLRGRRLAGFEIDDVVQETYARLAQAETVEGVRNPKAYTFQTAHSVLMSHARRSKVVSFQAVADIDHLGATSQDPSPETQAIDRDELVRLAEAIAEMPERVRDCFRLRRVEGLSQREVAQSLGIAESTVEKHIGRAIRILMDRFGRGGTATSGASSPRNERKARAADRPRD